MQNLFLLSKTEGVKKSAVRAKFFLCLKIPDSSEPSQENHSAQEQKIANCRIDTKLKCPLKAKKSKVRVEAWF